jgi:hypothetical protein
VDAIDGLRRRGHGGLKAERDVAQHQVVVDRLGHADAAKAQIQQGRRHAHRPVAADDHDRVELEVAIVLHHLVPSSMPQTSQP